MEKAPISRGKAEWLNQFIKSILKENCPPSQQEEYIGLIKEHYEKRALYVSEENKCFEEAIVQQRFFKYLETIKNKLTPEYIDTGVKTALKNPEEKDFISSFIKYIAITNLSDITITTGISENEDNFYAYPICFLGNYPLAEMELFSDNQNITFDNFIVNENVRRIGIGTLFLEKIISEIHEIYPDKEIYALTVLKENTPAIEFYKKLGFSIEEGCTDEMRTIRYKKENNYKKHVK